MNSRSLVLAAATLLIGIGIGSWLQRDPGRVRPTGASLQTDSGALESASAAPAANPGARSTAGAKATKPGALAALRPPRVAGRTPRAELRYDDRPAGPRRQAESRDDSFGSDELGLPIPEFVDEDGAADDFERYGDGPVSRSRREAEVGAETASRAMEDESPAFEAETCRPAFSPCGRDADCCGASVCRSRPGTISGYFECTPD